MTESDREPLAESGHQHADRLWCLDVIGGHAGETKAGHDQKRRNILLQSEEGLRDQGVEWCVHKRSVRSAVRQQ